MGYITVQISLQIKDLYQTSIGTVVYPIYRSGFFQLYLDYQHWVKIGVAAIEKNPEKAYKYYISVRLH